MKMIALIFGLCFVVSVHAQNSPGVASTLPAQPGQSTIAREDGSSEFNPADFADLQTYVNNAQESLRQTLESARNLGGPRLHSTLRGGIDQALQWSHESQNQQDPAQEILLFSTVLRRAQDIDNIYTRALTSVDNQTVTAAILLHSIHLARQYYQNEDQRRLSQRIVPSANWLAFARDQIHYLLVTIDLAPNDQSKNQLMQSILTWILNDINHSTNRRDIANLVQRLRSMREGIIAGHLPLNEAQTLLLSTESTLNQMIGGAGTPVPARPPAVSSAPPSGSVAPFPRQSYPGAATSIRRLDGSPRASSFFPIFGSPGSSVNAGRWASVIPVIDEQHTANPADYAGMAQVGGGYAYQSDYRNHQGQGEHFAAVSMLANVMYSINPRGGNIDFIGSLAADAQATLGQNADATIINLRVSGSAAAAYGFGVWVIMEANQFVRFNESVIRTVFGPTIPWRFGDTNYVILRVGVGVSPARGGGPEANFETAEDTTPVSIAASAFFRVAKCIVNVTFDHDRNYSSRRHNRVHRTGVAGTFGIPLGLFVNNDNLVFQGSHTRYDAVGIDDAVAVSIFSASYQVRW